MSYPTRTPRPPYDTHKSSPGCAMATIIVAGAMVIGLFVKTIGDNHGHWSSDILWDIIFGGAFLLCAYAMAQIFMNND